MIVRAAFLEISQKSRHFYGAFGGSQEVWQPKVIATVDGEKNLANELMW